MKTKSAATLTLNKPGEMSKRGRKQIADWLRRQARDLEKLGDQYSSKRLTARYLYTC